MIRKRGWIKGIIGFGVAGLLWSVPGFALADGESVEPPRIHEENGQPRSGQYIVLFKSELASAQREERVQRRGGSVHYNYRSTAAVSARQLSDQAAAELAADPDVLDVIPDREVQILKTSGSASATAAQTIPAGVSRIGASPGTIAYVGAGVGVAVMDTGLDFNHADLKPVAADCFTAYASCQDDEGHGTHVSGIVAARNNSQDVVGVAPGATLYAVKVLDQSGSGADSDVMAGFDWIAQNAHLVNPAIRVVNVSLGRPGTLNDNSALRSMVQTVTAMGITVVVSAGNDATKEVKNMVPATYPEVLAIASSAARGGTNACRRFSGTIKADTASYFTTDGKFDSLTGIGVTITAPGAEKENISRGCFIQSVGILSTRLGGGTASMSGTSMSAPHVTGVVSLMWERANSLSITLSSEEIRSLIRSGADLVAVAPLNSPASGYTYDGEREGILWAPDAVAAVGAP